jgi:hypothetical protein
VHHRDAGIERVARRVELNRLAGEEDLARVRTVEAREDVRERRLTGAVLPEQRMNLACGGLEVDAVVRDDAREPFGDSPERDAGRRWRGGVCLPAGTVSLWRYRSRL